MSDDALNSDRLRRRITIQKQVTSRDADGGVTYSYALRASVYAEVRPVTGREALVDQAITPLEQYTFLIRHRTDVAETDRIVWNGKNYDIINIAEIGRKVGLRIMAKIPGGEEAV